MPTGRSAAVEREARRLYDDLAVRRSTRFTTGDPRFRRDVLARVRQLMAGEDVTGGRYEDPDD